MWKLSELWIYFLAKCPDGKVGCPASDRCINREWLCDGDDDCGDNWDENVSKCPHKSTTATPRTTCKCSIWNQQKLALAKVFDICSR